MDKNDNQQSYLLNVFGDLRYIPSWRFESEDLKEFRMHYGLTQTDIANMLGCTVMTISNVETGRYDMSWEMRERLFRIINMAIVNIDDEYSKMIYFMDSRSVSELFALGKVSDKLGKRVVQLEAEIARLKSERDDNE